MSNDIDLDDLIAKDAIRDLKDTIRIRDLNDIDPDDLIAKDAIRDLKDAIRIKDMSVSFMSF